MNIQFKAIERSNYRHFHNLMNDYYRDGEDKDTSQDIINDFINRLFIMIEQKSMEGCLVKSDRRFIGFVLWMIDSTNSDFSELPGYGTIAEIGLDSSYRGKGIGKKIVTYAETQMKVSGIKGLYVLVYNQAKPFWESCGYSDIHKNGANGLPIFIKELR